jgi:hypothetical protein
LQNEQWIAIDDEAETSWQMLRNQFVECDPLMGLSDAIAQEHLRGWLEGRQ